MFDGLTHALATVHRGIALHGHEGEVVAVAVSPDGQRMSRPRAMGPDGAAVGRELGRATSDLRGPYGSRARGGVFSPDGATRLATASEDQTARQWDMNTGELLEIMTP